jgi:hypothetical protein
MAKATAAFEKKLNAKEAGMSAWRFSLVGLLAAVTFAAVACGALVNPNEWWTIGVTSATVTLLAYAVLAALYRAGARRAFWVGAAVIGWGYFGLLPFALGFNFESYGESPLITCRLLGMLGESRLDDSPQVISATGVNSNAGLSGDVITFTRSGNLYTRLLVGGVAANRDAWPNFYTIGHCLWSLLLAALGGLVALRLALARERQVSEPRRSGFPA